MGKFIRVDDEPVLGRRYLSVGGRVLVSWKRKRSLQKIEEERLKLLSLVANEAAKSSVATGILRELQCVQVEFLKVFKEFARRNELTFWIDFGTLIGAFRHDGFIPWDDDIDVTVPRNVYDKLLTMSDQLPEDFYFELNDNGTLIKLQHKKLPKRIGMDIFAADFVDNKFKIDELVKISREIVEEQRKCQNLPLTERKEKVGCYLDTQGFVRSKCLQHSSTMLYGVEFRHATHPSVLIPTEFLFPLSEVEFEGVSVPCPRRSSMHLKLLYGDWKVIKMAQVHVDLKSLSMSDLLAIEDFLEMAKERQNEA